jgi:diaminohydroxyphosphoribosylaminopyrimidine deaminase/5-amino-6-(5-phosphoribosylamino)uracil reductase
MALKDMEGEDLGEATLYVSLEPCSHHGKTPPCADLIVERGVGKVFIGAVDSHDKVAGQGVQRLRDAGIEVEVGVMEEACRWQNKRFFTFYEQKRPYVILKWARTSDGFIDVLREGGEALQISNSLSSQYVHRWRAEEMAILVGAETYRKDRPLMTTRLVHGPDPLPVIWSKSLTEDDLRPEHRGRALIMKSDNIEDLLRRLYTEGIQSILVEGGAETLRAFLDSGLYDEIRRITSAMQIGEGVKEPLWTGELAETSSLSSDRLEWAIRSPLYGRR